MSIDRLSPTTPPVVVIYPTRALLLIPCQFQPQAHCHSLQSYFYHGSRWFQSPWRWSFQILTSYSLYPVNLSSIPLQLPTLLVMKVKVKMKSLSRVRLFETLWTIVCQTSRPWDFPCKNTGVGCHFLLQGIFLTQGSNSGLLHCRQPLYHLTHQRILIISESSSLLITRPHHTLNFKCSVLDSSPHIFSSFLLAPQVQQFFCCTWDLQPVDSVAISPTSYRSLSSLCFLPNWKAPVKRCDHSLAYTSSLPLLILFSCCLEIFFSKPCQKPSPVPILCQHPQI